QEICLSFRPNISPPTHLIYIGIFSTLPQFPPSHKIAMSLRREWSEFERGMVWGAWLALGKKGVRKVSEITGIPKSTCSDIINMVEEEGLTKPPPRPGRPPVLTDRDLRHLKLTVEKNPLIQCQELSHRTSPLQKP